MFGVNEKANSIREGLGETLHWPFRKTFVDVCNISLAEPLIYFFIFLFFQDSDKSPSKFNGSRAGLLIRALEKSLFLSIWKYMYSLSGVMLILLWFKN